MRMLRLIGALVLTAACARGGTATGPEPTPISTGELRRFAMELLQDAVAIQMRLFVAEGRFSDDAEELEDAPFEFVPGRGLGGGRQVAVRICEEDRVVVLVTTSIDDAVFAVKARGLAPHRRGEAVFSHYRGTAACDLSDGPAMWPGGFFVSRQGLKQGSG